MDRYTADEVRNALLPIASLISKSEKAQLKLRAGTWQHAMLQNSLEALRIAQALLGQPRHHAPAASGEDLRAALVALNSTIGRVENTKPLAPGTSAHTLHRNRLKALRIAQAALEAELARL